MNFKARWGSEYIERQIDRNKNIDISDGLSRVYKIYEGDKLIYIGCTKKSPLLRLRVHLSECITIYAFNNKCKEVYRKKQRYFSKLYILDINLDVKIHSIHLDRGEAEIMERVLIFDGYEKGNDSLLNTVGTKSRNLIIRYKK